MNRPEDMVLFLTEKHKILTEIGELALASGLLEAANMIEELTRIISLSRHMIERGEFMGALDIMNKISKGTDDEKE